LPSEDAVPPSTVTALNYTYTTEEDCQAILSIEGETARVDDLNNGQPLSPIEQNYVNTYAINWATARCNFYLMGRYNDSDLATSWTVNQWCTILACKWLCSRRGNPVPNSIQDLYEDTIKDLEQVRSGLVDIPDLGLRTAAWPAWSNIRVPIWGNLRKARVERPISEQTPQVPPFNQNQDQTANWAFDWQ
jgi:phage gp36-like protein